jgi:hypothetical protein
MEHPEIFTCWAKYENNYYIDLIGNLIQAYLNSKLYYVMDIALVTFTNMVMLFGV